MVGAVKLRDLEPRFLKVIDGHTFQWKDVPFDQADGVTFLCLVCFVAKGGPIGTHQIRCWQPNIPQTVSPTGGRWHLRGTGIDDLTLIGEKSNSVLLKGGCNAHFHVVKGEIQGA